MIDVTNLLVRSDETIRAAMARLDKGGERILLLVDDAGRLRQTVTDGDLRRLVLAGRDLGETLECLQPKSPATVPLDTDPRVALGIMNDRQIDHVPVVDGDGRPVGVMLRREVDTPILLSTPHLGDEEFEFVRQAFDSNWIAPLGPNVDAFERELARHVGGGHAAALSSGTAAIHLALRLIGLQRGDVIFCSSLTFVASANPILYEGGVPVFIDAEPSTWGMSPAALERALASAAKRGALPKAVIAVNLYGQSCDLDPIEALCRRYDVILIEDAAESLGATYRGRHSGTIGALGAFSFNGNKIITTSGGGMLVSASEEWIKRARFLASQARDPAPWYQHTTVGYNYRMSNVSAGIGRGQLRALADRVAARRGVFERYAAGLADVEAIHWMPEADFGTSTRWLTAGTIAPESGITPPRLIADLARVGIEARHVWKPLHLQPLFEGCEYVTHAPGHSVSDELFANGVCLPSGSNMSEAHQERVIDAIRRSFGLVGTRRAPATSASA